MKKIIVLGFGLLISSMLNAAYLYWQVDSSALETAGITDGAYAKVVASSSGTYSETGTSTLLSSYSYVVPGDTSETPQISTPAGTTASTYWSNDNYADLTGTGSEYTYFVEIYNSQNQLVGHSDGVKYSDIAMVTNLSDIGSGAMMSTFNGAAYAVPEPTGALLVLIGAAMLGLKRRKV